MSAWHIGQVRVCFSAIAAKVNRNGSLHWKQCTERLTILAVLTASTTQTPTLPSSSYTQAQHLAKTFCRDHSGSLISNRATHPPAFFLAHPASSLLFCRAGDHGDRWPPWLE